MTDDLREVILRMDREFTQLIQAHGHLLQPSCLEEVRMYALDHGEYGLALETFAGIVVNLSLPVSEACVAQLMSIARLLDMQKNSIVRSLDEYHKAQGRRGQSP